MDFQEDRRYKVKTGKLLKCITEQATKKEYEEIISDNSFKQFLQTICDYEEGKTDLKYNLLEAFPLYRISSTFKKFQSLEKLTNYEEQAVKSLRRSLLHAHLVQPWLST